MVAVLQQLGGGRLIPIDRAVVLVGRSADCDVVIASSQKISRHHCCLVQVDNSYYIRDLGSMNGVWVNGDRVNRDMIMNSGDRICIGDVEFQFYPNVRVEPRKPNSAAPPTTGDVSAAVSDSEPAASAPTQPAEISAVQPRAESLPTDKTLQERRPAPRPRRKAGDNVEILDDVIPLSELPAPLPGTHELEAINEEIIDDQDPDGLDDLITCDADD
ncbi:MAG: FHA domain-containing protein [Planctomycetaceae bacterium]